MFGKMKSKKRIFLIVVVCALAIAWTIRYVSLNKYWRAVLPGECKIVIFNIGEEVPFENNIMVSPNIYAKGASITVNNVQILDYQSFIEDNQIGQNRTPNRNAKLVVVLDVTFENKGEDDVTINVMDYYLHGIDQYFTVDANIMEMINPNVIIELQTGVKFEAVLIYPISENRLSRQTWKNFDKYSLYLMATIHPERKEIKIQ